MMGAGNVIAILIAALGPVGVIIAAIIVGHIVLIQAHNEGNGVMFLAVIFFFPQGVGVRNIHPPGELRDSMNVQTTSNEEMHAEIRIN